MGGNGQTQETKTPPILYCLYSRKSSDSDERQAMSIESQIKEMNTLAEREKLKVKEIRQESHSAKISGTRPVFNQLLEDIREEKFNGILTWAPDRLSRNAGDLGMLVDLMDQGKLVQIRTFSQTFTNNPNEKFLLMILCSQAKLENDQKGLNVKRGIRAKCEMGWRPGVAPLGYFNRAFGGVKDIVIDPERGPMVKEMFERVAYKSHSGRTIKIWLDKVGFKSRQGKYIALSEVYLMLKNTFYYGEFEYSVGSGNWYKGAYEPLITKEVFDRVQKELEVPEKVYGVKFFPLKRIFKCYSCGSGVTGEEKLRKLINGTFRRHVYYHCTRSRDFHCKEPYIDEKDLLNELMSQVESLDDGEIHVPENLKETMGEYTKITEEAKYLSGNSYEDEEVTLKDCIKYVLREGTPSARKGLIEALPLPRRLHDRKLAP